MLGSALRRYQCRINRSRTQQLGHARMTLAGAVLAAAFALASCSTAPKPKIGFSPSTVTLTATAGAMASGSVEVKNVGGGTLQGLNAAVGAYSSGASAWLTVNLSDAAAPASLALAANTATLNVGSYSAVVNVSSAGASPQTTTLTVNLTVTE